MSTEPTEREPVTPPEPTSSDEPHVHRPSLAANVHAADREAPATRPVRHRPPAQIAGVVLPAWAPWVAVGGAAVVMLLMSLINGFNLALFIVGTVILGGVAQYVWSRSVEGP